MRFARKASLIAGLVAVVIPGSAVIGQENPAVTAAPSQNLPPLPNPHSTTPRQASRANQTNPTTVTADAVIMNSRSFGIPFNIDAAGTLPAEVQLLVSRGDSKWQLLDRKPPQVRQFQFQGTDDGLFWFATRTVDSLGNPFPKGPLKPQLKVFIDTTKPDVSLQVEADASGRVDVAIQMNDATPAKNVRLHYVTDVVREWQIVDVRPMLATGKLSFFPKHHWQQLSLQTIVVDSAGNRTTQSRLIQRPRVAKSADPRLTAKQPAVSDDDPLMEASSGPGDHNTSAKLVQTTTGQLRPSLPGYRVDASGLPIRGMPAQMTPNGLQLTPHNQLTFGPPSLINSSAEYPSANTTGSPRDSAAASSIFSLNGPTPAAGGQAAGSQAWTESDKSPPRTPGEAMRPLTDKSAVTQWTSSSEGQPLQKPDSAVIEAYKARRLSEIESNEAHGRGRVPVRYSDSERFSLEYELQAIAASGVEAVELYGSTTGGKTWSLWGSDPDRATPFDIETKGEGVFGYRVVVVGQNGLASPRPLDGEVPDIIVVVDKTEPKVRVTSAQYGAGDRTGSLVIGYEASDENLVKRPVALSFSDKVGGPWTTIAAGLRNDGMYVWPADPELPRQIYLRIDVKDLAGNIGTYVLEEPIETQGLAPRARIRGFQSLSGNSIELDAQTAERPRASFK